jgi:predicted metal-dependent enzyme (double-stranded beta helix superfamily)
LSVASPGEPNLDLLHEEEDHSLAVMLVSWPAKFGVNPHDHDTWAVVAGVRGQEHNTTYARVDDGADPKRAELAIKAEASLSAGGLVCMKSGGIHAVRNDGDEVAVSLHTYGRHVNHTDRVQFDLETGEVRPLKV